MIQKDQGGTDAPARMFGKKEGFFIVSALLILAFVFSVMAVIWKYLLILLK